MKIKLIPAVTSLLSFFLIYCQSPIKNNVYERTPSAESRPLSSSMLELQKSFEDEPSEELRHKVGYSRIDNKVVVKIGVVKRAQKESMIAIFKAIKNQQIDRIDGGMVVGAKTLIFLSSLRGLTAFKDFEIVGLYDLAGIYKEFQRESKKTAEYLQKNHLETLNPSALRDPYLWTAKEISDFSKSIKELGLEQEVKKSLQEPDYIGHFIRLKWIDEKENNIQIGPPSDYIMDL